jgi:hypothetical protein
VALIMIGAGLISYSEHAKSNEPPFKTTPAAPENTEAPG